MTEKRRTNTLNYSATQTTWGALKVDNSEIIVNYRWRVPHAWNCQQNALAGKHFKLNGVDRICTSSTTNQVFYGDNQVAKRKEIRAYVENKMRWRTPTELLWQLKVMDSKATLFLPEIGCQLHGDKDYKVTLHGINYTIPY